MRAEASDAELVGRSLAGAPDAFVEMVQRHEVAIGAYLARRCGRGVAEELLADVWLESFRSRKTYDRSFENARPWLFGVARNVLRRHWRSLPRETPTDNVDVIGNAWNPWPAVDCRLDVEDVLRQVLDMLPAQEREILTLIVWDDLTIADAARSLGIPTGTAYRLLHQARMTLRGVPSVAAMLADDGAVKRSR